MAKTMLLMSSTVQAGYSIDLKRDSLIQLNSQRLWPRFSPHLFNPLPSTSFSFSSSSSSRIFTTLALFKSKTKAPPSKVINCFSNYFIILNNLCTLFIFFFDLAYWIWSCHVIYTGCEAQAKGKGWRWHFWHFWGFWFYQAERALCWSCCHARFCCESKFHSIALLALLPHDFLFLLIFNRFIVSYTHTHVMYDCNLIG